MSLKNFDFGDCSVHRTLWQFAGHDSSFCVVSVGVGRVNGCWMFCLGSALRTGPTSIALQPLLCADLSHCILTLTLRSTLFTCYYEPNPLHWVVFVSPQAFARISPCPANMSQRLLKR